MERAVDVLFIVGLMLNLIKASDLLLRPHQQKWVQRKVDDLALSLDYTKPLDWYRRNHSRVFWLLFLVCAGLTVWLLVRTTKRNFEFIEIVIVGLVLVAVSGAFPSDVLNAEADDSWRERLNSRGRKFSKSLTTWILSSTTLTQHLLRPLVLFTLALLPCVIVFLVITKDNGHLVTFVKNTSLLTRVVFLAFVFFTLPLIVFLENIFISTVFHGLISIFIFSLTVIFLALELLLKFCRGLVYRIAEYNKGAFAAIMILVTLVLGVTEFYLKYPRAAPPQPNPIQTSPSPSQSR